MSSAPWFRLPRAVQQREADRTLAEWLDREVVRFSPFWRSRLASTSVRTTDDLRLINPVREADVAGAGGPGNPSLLLSPTEDDFKRHAPRGELVAAARAAAGEGVGGRRNAIWRRYKPVHVHEAGVDRLLAIAYTRSDLDLLHLAGARLAEVLGWGAEDALLSLVPAGPSIRFWGMYHAALASRMTALHPRGVAEAIMGPARRGLALMPASVLALPTDEAESTLDALAGAAVKVPNLRQVVVVGPPPTPALRVSLSALAERLVGRPVPVQAAWAPECSRVLYGESPPAADDPPEATYGLLTYPDMEVLSVYDHTTGADAADGTAGELVLTSMGWRGTALVRYATGSWVGGIERAANHPMTGATVPRLAPQAVDGAWQPRVQTSAGLVRPDLRGIGRVLGPSARQLGARDWSIRAESGRLVLALALASSPSPAELTALAGRVGRECGVQPEVQIDPVAAARRPQVGMAGAVGQPPAG